MLTGIAIDPKKFIFEALPSYADFLLNQKLDAYITTVLEFSRQESLPLLKMLEKFSDEELMQISRISGQETFSALAGNTIHLHIESNLRKWVTNNLEVIDKHEVAPEDITVLAYIKRKAMQHYIADYTSDAQLSAKLIAEIDVYTTQEELIVYKTYLKIQQEQLKKTNEDLSFQENLLLEVQDIAELGSFFMDLVTPENSTKTPQMVRITGLDHNNQSEFFNYVHPDDLPNIKKLWQEALDNGGPFEYSYRYIKDGTEKTLISKGLVTRENDRPVNVKGMVRDITKTEKLLHKLTQSEALHKEAQRLTHLGNWSWDVSSDTIRWSDEMYRIYGLEPQSEAITFERFTGMIHPDDRERRIAEIRKTLQTGEPHDYSLKIITPQGDLKILRGYSNLDRDPSGNPLRLYGTCQDVTREQLLRNELMSLNHSLSQKNIALGNTNRELESFTYIASHDLQEPLRKIQLFTERLLVEADNLNAGARASLEKVISSAGRLQRLITDLIKFSKVAAPDAALEDVSLSEMVTEVTAGFFDAEPDEAPLFEIGELPQVRVIRFQFLQLLSNLIGNAIKYRRKNERVKISITSQTVDAAKEGLDDASGKYLKISICDNGIGFDPQQREHIFGLFKRLHSGSEYSGTGIGLAICKKIIDNHNGFLTADSVVGEGSCFYIYLPQQ